MKHRTESLWLNSVLLIPVVGCRRRLVSRGLRGRRLLPWFSYCGCGCMRFHGERLPDSSGTRRGEGSRLIYKNEGRVARGGKVLEGAKPWLSVDAAGSSRSSLFGSQSPLSAPTIHIAAGRGKESGPAEGAPPGQARYLRIPHRDRWTSVPGSGGIPTQVLRHGAGAETATRVQAAHFSMFQDWAERASHHEDRHQA